MREAALHGRERNVAVSSPGGRLPQSAVGLTSLATLACASIDSKKFETYRKAHDLHPGAINLVAMDDQPVFTSNRLVLTTVARAENFHRSR